MNGGRIVHAPPEPHRCPFYVRDRGPVGTVWQCGECGTHWRREPRRRRRPQGWYVLSGVRLWAWKRKQARR